MKLPDIVKKYIEIREYIARETAAHDTKLKPYADAMSALEGAAQKIFYETGQTNAKTEFGTAFEKTNTRIRLSDRDAFVAFVRESEDGLDYFTNALAKAKVQEYLDGSAGEPPPGVEVTYVKEIQFRKPNS